MPGLRHSKKLTALLAAALTGAAAGIGCGRIPSGVRPGGADTAYVGVGVGLQTPQSYVNVYKGVQQALDELNATRPPGAPPLALRRAPAGASSQVEVAAAFRDDRAVIGVVGHTESDATISAAPVYDDRADGGRRALVAVSPTASSQLVTGVSDWIFRVCPVVDDQAKLLARYAADSLHLRTAAIVYRNDASGRGFLRAFAAEFQARGGTVTERDPIVETIPEFDLYARRIAGRGAQALVIGANAREALQLIRAVRAAGASPTVLGWNGSNPSAQQLHDPEVAATARGLRYLALYDPARPLTPRAARFAADFQKRYGEPPDHWAALSYDAAMLIGTAVHTVGPDRRRIRDWLAQVGRERPAFEGATGVIRFDALRDPVEKPALVATLAPVTP